MRSEKKKYESFEVVDLVLNGDFIQLVSEKGDMNLNDFIENSEGHEQNIRFASKIILGLHQKKQPQSLDLKYRLWRRIQNNHRREKYFAVLRYAAILFLFLSLGGGILYWNNQPHRIVDLAESNPAEYEQFKLILSDGKNVFLTGSSPTVKSTDQGKTILLNDSVRINQPSVGFNQVIVPYGRRITVFLADGTQVRLNSGSRLVYPPQFSENKREVYLEGEGLFNVKNNEDRPFYVQTDKFKVQVLGTTF
ncbi:MAG: FecR domain-containing protein, partial [Deltaproteobacteria bacterium]|nr:FecR domain-containing protein [Deltaproteobacteria bacterium]